MAYVLFLAKTINAPPMGLLTYLMTSFLSYTKLVAFDTREDDWEVSLVILR
jgi:hypothetical protein